MLEVKETKEEVKEDVPTCATCLEQFERKGVLHRKHLVVVTNFIPSVS